MTGGLPDVQRRLIEECQGLVRSLAGSVHRKLPARVDLNDLVGYGQVGLSEAARDFDPTRGVRFSTYAYYRIRGAIYEGLSKMSWFGRAARDGIRYKQLSDEVLRLEGQDRDAAAAGGVADDVAWLQNVSRALAVVYLATHIHGGSEARSGYDDGQTLEAGLVDRSARPAVAVAIEHEIHRRLRQLIDELPARARALIQATYFEGLTLQEAGQRLGISKSWASRLHARALEQLAHSLRAADLAS